MNGKDDLTDLAKRKIDHIELASNSQIDSKFVDKRFNYEPLFSAHPKAFFNESITFLGKRLAAPIWISSMTGGSCEALKINQNLARVANKYGLGMGLGSCRPLLKNGKNYFKDFDLRQIIGEDLPFFANLGIAQIASLISQHRISAILDLVEKLQVDGLIIHINPLQEWFQERGDRFDFSPFEVLQQFIEGIGEIRKCKIIVKEVGQGFGPKSLKSLMLLPISAIEFGALGGTNFTKLEILRNGINEAPYTSMPFSYVGHTAEEMVEMIKQIFASSKNVKCKEFIISGGIKTSLDAYYLMKKLNEIDEVTAIIGRAYLFLKYARISLERLDRFVENEIKALALAKSFLELR